MAAPGLGIHATVPGGSNQPVDGASVSAPEVTAPDGLLSALGLTDDNVRGRMQNTATDLAVCEDDCSTGTPAPDAANTVT